MNNELIEKIVRSAFKKGENWGVCYSTWFTPSKEETNQQIKIAINNAKRMVKRLEREGKTI